jgi:hypothetical protein
MGKSTYGEWGSGDRFAAPPETPARHRAKKNTKRWCKGKEGREHGWEFIVPDYGMLAFNQGCRWSRWSSPLRPQRKWFCYHYWVCKNCGKIDYNKRDQPCPDFTHP